MAEVARAFYALPGDSPYCVLRDDARRLRANIEHAIAGDKVETLVLDFSAIEAVTNGWADEFLADLAQSHRIIIKGANDEVKDALETAVDRRNLTTVTFGDGHA